VLVDRRLELTPKLAWSAVVAGSAILGRAGRERAEGRPISLRSFSRHRPTPSGETRCTSTAGRPRRCAFTVASLVTNAVWLGAPFAEESSNRNILLEALRMLPPSRNILRRG